MKKWMKYLIAAFLLMISCGIAGMLIYQAVASRNIAESLVRAEKAVADGRYAEAGEALGRVLRADNGNERALVLFAEMTEKEHAYDVSALIWKRLCRINPLESSYSLRYVVALNTMMDYRSVIDFFSKEKRAAKPGDPERLEWGIAELGAGNLVRAEELFKQCTRNSANSEAYDLLQGMLLASEGKKQKASAIFQRICDAPTTSDARRFSALLSLGSLAADAKKEELYRRAARLYPLIGNHALAEFYCSKGDFSGGVKLLEAVPEKERSFAQLRQLGEAYAALGEKEKLQRLARTLRVSSRPGIVLKNYLEAISFYLANNYPEVEKRLDNCRDFAGRPLYALMRFESLIARKGTAADILLAAGELAAVSPGRENRKKIDEALGRVLVRLVGEKNYSAGVLVGEALLAGKEGKSEWERLLLLCYLDDSKHFSDAGVLARKILASAPKDVTALRALATLAAVSGDDRQVLLAATRLHAVEPKSEFALSLLGAVEERKGNRKKAEEYFREAYRLERSANAEDRLFWFLFRTDRKKAAQFVETEFPAAARKKDGGRSALYRGVLADREGNREAAKSYLRKAIADGLNIPGVYIYLAEQETTPAAREKVMEEGVKRFPDFVAGLNFLGQLCNSSGQVERAAEYYSRALKLEPDNLLTLLNCSEIFAALKRPGEAMDLALRARKIAPRNDNVRECYAMRELERGEFLPAIREFDYLLASGYPGERIKPSLIAALNGEGKNRLASDVPGAKKYFLRAQKLDPASVEAAAGLAEVKKQEEAKRK